MQADHAVAGPVRVPLDAAAELQADAPEVHLLVGERRHGRQVGAGRQGLEAGGLEVAYLRPGAEASGEPLGLPLVELRPHDVGAVVEARADVLEAVLHLELVVAPVDDVHRHAQPFDEAVAQVPQAEVDAAYLAPRGEVDLEAPLLALVLVITLVPVAGVVRVVRVVDVVRAVELLGERHAVAALLEGEAAAGEEGAVVVARAGARVRELGRGIGNGALRGVVVAGAPRAAAGPHAESALGVLHVDVDPGLAVGAPEVGGELGARALEHRLVHGLLRRDDVDEAAHGVRPVQQGGRTADDLDAIGAVGVDGDAVVSGLAGEVARANAVVEDEHAVAVEAADDGPARAGAEAADRDAGLVLQRVAEAVLAGLDEVERVQRRHGVERLERRLRAPGGGGDRHLLVHRRRGQLEVGHRDLAGGDGNHLPSGGQVLALGEHLVGARRHVLERVGPVVLGERRRARADHQHHGAVHRPGVADQRHRPLHRPGFLRSGGRPRQGDRRRNRRREPPRPSSSELHRFPFRPLHADLHLLHASRRAADARSHRAHAPGTPGPPCLRFLTWRGQV